MKIAKYALLPAVCGALYACSGPVKDNTGQDALKNTKKLAAEGHATLYHNGAFEVPMTTIHLIPAGPGALDLAMEMGGMRARQSFEESLKHAREAKEFAQAGVDKSVSAAQAINAGTNATAASARGVTRLGRDIVRAAPGAGYDIAAAAVSYSHEAGEAVAQSGERLASSSQATGAKVSSDTAATAAYLNEASKSGAERTSRASESAAARHLDQAHDRFVMGYAAVPEKLERRGAAVADSASLGHFVDAYQRSDDWRADQSGKFTDIMVRTTDNYAEDAAKPFHAAKQEITTGAQDSGYTLATLKSLRWLVQGIFWDATIKPVGKMAGASLGYLTVNGAAFPTLVLVREGKAVANVAVQVAWNGAGGVYDITAPTATSALAGLLGAAELVGGKSAAVAERAGGAVAAGGVYGAGKVAAGVTEGGGWVAGKTVHYVGAPLSTLGVAVGGGATGVVAGTLGVAAGGGMMATGLVSEGATQVAGKATAGTVAVGGSVASVAAGTGLAVYEASKAVVVPAGYEVGAGIVLSYDTMAQLGAQSVLAVSDASYMVLSLEGPRWVLYAVKGNVGRGDNLPPGAVVDLKAMQQAGETLEVVPASPAEVERVVNSVPAQLQVRPPAATTASR